MTLAEALRKLKEKLALIDLADKLDPYITHPNSEGAFSGTMDDITDGATYVKTENNYTDAEKTKLSGIATGAEVNVNADWNSASGDSQILNKPTIPTVSDTAYDSTSWNGNTDAPTKNAVRDEIESLWTDIGYAITEDFSVYPLVEDTRDIEGAVFLMQTSLGVTMQVTYETLLSKIQADLGL